MESIISPYQEQPPRLDVVTKEVLEKVKEMTKCGCVFVVVSSEEPNHICAPGKCKGHILNINTEGFNPEQILGLAEMLANQAGYKLVPRII